MALQFYGALIWRGDRLNLSFFFGLEWGVQAYKTIARTLQKRAGKRQVWLLHWNEAIGWDEMELVSGLFFVWLACWKRTGQAKWIWGWKSR